MCVSVCGLHSSSLPSDLCLLLSSSSVGVFFVGLVWLLVSCLSIGSLFRVLLVEVV